MTGLRRNLGFLVALAILHVPALASRPDELKDTFNQGVEALRRGQNDEALKAFQKVLAMSPSQQAAYELWQENEYTVWRDILVEGGEFELIGKRLIELARMARKERRQDAAAIQPLVNEVTSGDDAIARRKALRTLSAEHGEFAVPYLIPLLSTQGSDDRRVLAMLALSQLGPEAVPALAESLRAKDPLIRRHVVMVLANIGDQRAAGCLLWLSNSDPEDSVRSAAREGAQKLGARGDALTNFLSLGDAYYQGHDSAVRDEGARDVLWSWQDEKLVAMPVPPSLYNDEMSKRAYSHALTVYPSSTDALAGLVRAYVDENEKVKAAEAAGVDLGEWKNISTEAHMAVALVGVDALNTALLWSVKSGDASTAVALCRTLGPLCKTPPPGLLAAFASDLGAVRSEAAVALGQIAAQSNSPAPADVVAALGEAAGREVMRMAAVIDGDAARAASLAQALEKEGVYVQRWSTGGKGLAMLRRAPGIDLVLVADALPDVTTMQVIDEIRADDRTRAVPVLIVTKDAEGTVGLYGDKIAGTIAGGEDAKAIEAAMSKELTGDRAMAEGLSARAAQALSHLAHAGRTDLAAAVPQLVNTLATRSDEVTVPAMWVIGRVGAQGHAAQLLAVLTDAERSEAARVAAGDALAGVLGRYPTSLGPDAVDQLRAVISSQVPGPVREAASHALGEVQIDPATRASVLQGLGAKASE